MNQYDFYFEQLISQTEMDQAFSWVADALERWTQDALSDPTDPGGAWNGGVLEGGEVTQQTVPDLSVRVSAFVAYDKIGRPVIDATAQQTVPVDVDEYGTTTAVAAPGNSKILSVFLRYKLNPQDPAVDGNGLTVYTKQLDDTEIFVRQSAEAAIPSAPPRLPDALLLADISMAYGQTTVLTGHIGFVRREDWLRLVGTTITSFVAGTPREALRQLFAYVDTAVGGGSAYTPNYNWAGAVPLGTVGGAPPTTMQEAVDDVVQDLANNTVAGNALVGALAITGTAGGRGDQGAGTVAGQLSAMAGLIASHTGACVQVSARSDWAWLLLSTTSGFAAGAITSQASGTATAVAVLGGNSGWMLVHTIAGTWTVGQGMDYGGSYVAPAAYLLARVDLPDVLTATDLQTVAYAAAAEMARLGRTAVDEDRYYYGSETSSAVRQDHAHLGGAGSPAGALADLRNGYTVDDDESVWALPYQVGVQCDAGNLIDICAGWAYDLNAACVYAVGDTTKISRVYLDPDQTEGIREQWMNLTIDAAGTLMSTLSPTREPYAVACNGDTFYVLVSSAAAGGAAEIYAYDARVWRSSGSAQWIWTYAMPYLAGCMGTDKWRSNLVANSRYVVALLGAEDCSTGTPLCLVDEATGLNAVFGKGDGASAAGFIPSGGLAISKALTAANHRIFYTCQDDINVLYECVPALHDLTATGKPRMGLLDVCRDVVLVGRFVGLLEEDVGGAGIHYMRFWDYETNDTVGICLQVQNTSITYGAARAAFDGTNIWLKLCSNLGGEQHIVTSVHPAELVNCGLTLSQIIACDRRYLVTPPKSSGASAAGSMGRLVAWGPGVFSIWGEAADVIKFLPLNRGVR